MAVYNQVSKPTLSSEPPSDEPNDGTRNRPSHNEKDGLKDNSLEPTQNENDSIKMDYNESNTEWGRMSEPSHFTVAGSPTRKRDFL